MSLDFGIRLLRTPVLYLASRSMLYRARLRLYIVRRRKDQRQPGRTARVTTKMGQNPHTSSCSAASKRNSLSLMFHT